MSAPVVARPASPLLAANAAHVPKSHVPVCSATGNAWNCWNARTTSASAAVKTSSKGTRSRLSTSSAVTSWTHGPLAPTPTTLADAARRPAAVPGPHTPSTDADPDAIWIARTAADAVLVSTRPLVLPYAPPSASAYVRLRYCWTERMVDEPSVASRIRSVVSSAPYRWGESVGTPSATPSSVRSSCTAATVGASHVPVVATVGKPLQTSPAWASFRQVPASGPTSWPTSPCCSRPFLVAGPTVGTTGVMPRRDWVAWARPVTVPAPVWPSSVTCTQPATWPKVVLSHFWTARTPGSDAVVAADVAVVVVAASAGVARTAEAIGTEAAMPRSAVRREICTVCLPGRRSRRARGRDAATEVGDNLASEHGKVPSSTRRSSDELLSRP